MADDVKIAMHNECDKGGGLYCPCCNPYHGKTKKQLNRIARSREKRRVNKDIQQELQTDE